MLRIGAAGFALVVGCFLTGSAFAQPCYSAAQCGAIRQQAEQQFQAQQEAAARYAAIRERERQQAVMRARQIEEQARQAAAARVAAQIAAEDSPDNYCNDRPVARKVLESFNGLSHSKRTEAVDIEHLTTVQFDTDRQLVVCHGVFMLTSGYRLVGTITIRPNVAGDLITVWQIDR